MCLTFSFSIFLFFFSTYSIFKLIGYDSRYTYDRGTAQKKKKKKTTTIPSHAALNEVAVHRYREGVVESVRKAKRIYVLVKLISWKLSTNINRIIFDMPRNNRLVYELVTLLV